MALALAAMVATTTFAHADGIGVTTSGQVGLPQTGSGSTPGVTSTAWANTDCAGAACGGNASGSLGYNFAYTSIATAKSGATGSAGTVGMDSATTTDSLCTTCTLLALEADNYSRAAMTDTITGLTNGTAYSLTFDFAEDQQSTATCGGNCNGPFEAQLGVTNIGGASVNSSFVLLGGAQQTTQTFASGWNSETINFTASGTSEELAFLAGSNLTTQIPAFALIDNFNLTPTPPVPEPNSLLLLSTGLLGLGGYMRMRSKSGAAIKA
jgi:hypothetical protein